MKLPAIEVRYMNLSVEAECEVVHGKPLPTLWTSFQRMFSVSHFFSPNIVLQLTMRLCLGVHMS